MNIDLRKVYEQDEDFRKYVQESIITLIEKDTNFIETLTSMYAMYQTGVTSDTMIAMTRLQNMIKSSEDE